MQHHQIVNGKKAEPYCYIKPNEKIGKFYITDFLGSGAFANVYGCNLCQKTGEAENDINNNVALKIYRKLKDQTYYETEVQMLNLLFEAKEPPNIIKMLNTFVHIGFDDMKPVQFPVIAFKQYNCTLYDFIRHYRNELKTRLPLEFVAKSMQCLFKGLEWIHQHDIIHCDIKTDNLLIDIPIGELTPENIKDANIVICDFGSAIFGHDYDAFPRGTNGFMAPEMLLGLPLSTAADIWSASVTHLELLCNHLIFRDDNKYKFDYDGDKIFDTDESDDDDVPELVSSADFEKDQKEGSEESNTESSSSDGDKNDDKGENEESYSESDNLSYFTFNGKRISRDSSYDTTHTHSEHREDDLLMFHLFEKFLGPAPADLTIFGRKYFDRYGKLMGKPPITKTIDIWAWLVKNKLIDENCQISKSHCDLITHCLTYMPSERIMATLALKHKIFGPK